MGKGVVNAGIYYRDGKMMRLRIEYIYVVECPGTLLENAKNNNWIRQDPERLDYETERTLAKAR